MQHHKYSLTELENMLPWERDIYVTMLIQYIEEENERIKQQQASMKRQMAITNKEIEEAEQMKKELGSISRDLRFVASAK